MLHLAMLCYPCENLALLALRFPLFCTKTANFLLWILKNIPAKKYYFYSHKLLLQLSINFPAVSLPCTHYELAFISL